MKEPSGNLTLEKLQKIEKLTGDVCKKMLTDGGTEII